MIGIYVFHIQTVVVHLTTVKIAALTSELAAEKQRTARVKVEKAALESKLYEHARLRDLLECVISCIM
jgi:hypothetical protein